MGFKFEKRKRQAVLLERQDIILWRRNYLRKIRNLRQGNEMIWRQVKGYVARGNKTFKLNEIKELVIKGIENVSTQNWANCINHVIKKEKEMWEIDGLVDEIWENQNFIISVNSDSSDSYSEIMSADDL
ncbi:hypothetical protein TNCT_457061 [Trichonephila clavata]|uniref:Uncharacterized protein n=1 Tax=Trichonephila clavata TaxID=2740835 RepID=A0A8X6FUH7_TRICU|nr:hypothetical protein TNCT_457061 [Trichonephila clavata]